MHTYMIYIYSKNILPYIYKCTIRACVPSWYARRLFWKKSPFWTGCPCRSVDVYSARTLLNLDFAVRIDRKSLGFSRALEWERCQGQAERSNRDFGGQDSKRLDCSVALLLQGEAKAGGEVWNEITKQSFQTLRLFPQKWILTLMPRQIYNSAIILWSFCDHVDESAVDRSCKSHSAPGAGGLPRTEESGSWSGHRWTLVEKVLKLGHVRKKL